MQLTHIHKLVTVPELAETLHVPVKTIYAWLSRTNIPRLKVGKHVRFDIDSVLQYFAERTANSGCVMAKPSIKSEAFDCSLKIGRDAAHSSRRE